MNALAIVHEPGQTIGRIGVRLRERGVCIVETLISSQVGDPLGTLDVDSPETFDLIITMGSRWNVHNPAPVSSWIHDELNFLKAADATGVPVLGVCFGAQALAASLGGDVSPCQRSQIGWYSPIAELDIFSGPWFEWHSDGFHLPDDAQILAYDDTAIQAFRLRRNVGVQFHPEVGSAHLNWWLDHGGKAALLEAGIDVASLVAETATIEPDAHRRCDRLVDWFLDNIINA